MDNSMDSDSNSVKMWLDFIKNRIERTYAKQRTSGVTTWILLSVAFYLISHGFDAVFNMHEGQFTFFLLSITTFANLIWPLFYLFSVLKNLSSHKKTTILFGVQNSIYNVVCGFFFALFLSVVILNCYAIYIKVIPVNNFFYWFFIIFYIVILAGILLQIVSSMKYGFIVLNNRFEFNRYVVFFRFITNISIQCYAIYFCFNFLIEFKSEYISMIAACSFILSIIILMLICLRLHGDSVIVALQGLEEKIIMGKVSYEKISHEYSIITDGYAVSQWCASKEIELKEMVRKILKESATITEKLDNVAKINGEMKYEIKGRLGEALEEFETIKDQYNDFIKKTIMQLKKLRTEVVDDDMKHLMHAVDALDNEIKNSKVHFDALLEKAKKLRM